ncbi:olfactory receptor 6M1-like [Alligator mississippiensis]|uniref:olfactory receptor 6M1-like n=1 Tax=Alligator mississippiensis TaxID=8496 RepID=UPI00287781A7|nr:olfactory receptor 6M1-like [Alligator mississippiensis]
MEKANQTSVKEFIIMGFPNLRLFKILFFLILMVIYVLTLMGNTLIIALVWRDCRLHSPMYWFLCNLSFSGFCFTTVILPKTMESIVSDNHMISFSSCITQTYFYFFLGTSEYILVAVMSFDRYIAICKPLHYPIIMSGQLTLQLLICTWMGAFVSVLCPTILVSQLPFCGPNVINHFFCDIRPLLHLACVDTSLIERVNSTFASLVVLSSLFLTTVSYLYIIHTILHIPSAIGRQKAFSTCAAHITVASIFYSCSIFMYVLPKKLHSSDFYKLVAFLHTVITPLLNPFIYTLRNEKVQIIFKETFRQRTGNVSERF